MLPPVFYVQQLEQILLRKLLSPPTPAARPLRFLPAPRCAATLMSVFNFFVRFFRAKLRPLISRVCAVRRSRINIWFSRFSVFLDPYFRRFYDFFLRRKYLESLVRVIRRFGVRPRATRAKKISGLTFSPAGL